MEFAEAWFESQKSNSTEMDRRVYLATDDPDVASNITNRCLYVLLSNGSLSVFCGNIKSMAMAKTQLYRVKTVHTFKIDSEIIFTSLLALYLLRSVGTLILCRELSSLMPVLAMV